MGSSAVSWSPGPLEPPLASNEEMTCGRSRLGAPEDAQPTMRPIGPNFIQEAPRGSQCRLWMCGHVLRWFGSSSRPMDPRTSA